MEPVPHKSMNKQLPYKEKIQDIRKKSGSRNVFSVSQHYYVTSMVNDCYVFALIPFINKIFLLYTIFYCSAIINQKWEICRER